MAIELVEQVKSRQTSEKQSTLLYIAYTTEGETSTAILQEMRVHAPYVWGVGLARKDIQVNPTERDDVFFCVASYGKGNNSPTPPEALNQTSSMSFQYHTEQMFTALDSEGWLGDGVSTLPDIKNAIMMPKDKAPQGVNVQKAGLVMGLGYVVERMPLSYIVKLAQTAMHVNSSAFHTPLGTFAAKEVQFVDMNYTQQPSGNFNLSLKYRIEASQKITVDDLNGGSEMSVKPYWRFWTQDCSGADPSQLHHIAAFQSQVYPEGNLNHTIPSSSIIVRR